MNSFVRRSLGLFCQTVKPSILQIVNQLQGKNHACQYCTRPKYNYVKPGKVSPFCPVPDSVSKPDYVSESFSGFKTPMEIEIKSEAQIQGMRDSCRLAADILNTVAMAVRPGITTDELDKLAQAECVKNNAYPSPLLYKGFPKAICTSVNNVCCHGIPDNRSLLEGDIINVDITVFYNGFHGDTSRTIAVGQIDSDAHHLMQVTKECLDLAISACKPGVPFRTIGATIQSHATSCGLTVIPHFCGHGIGDYFHGLPSILHFENDEPGYMLPGMTFTIEPILSEGSWEITVLKDGWTAISCDYTRSAQYEHTILITDTGHQILTKL